MKTKKQLTIPIPPNFSFKQCLSYLDRGFNDCLYHITDNSISKYIHLSNEKFLINIYEENKKLHVEIFSEKINSQNIREVEKYIYDWFDLKRDITPFYNLLNQIEELKKIPNLYFGTRLIGIPNLFEALCWCVIGQQINLTFAYKLKRLLVEKFGEKIVYGNTNYYLFPTPEVLLKVEKDDLVKMKFSRQKIDYINNISKAFVDHQMNKEILLNCNNKEEQIVKLTEIKGVGIWTANYVLMKTLREMSCITFGDSGLNNALNKIFNTAKKPNKSEINNIFKNFVNWESYLNFYFWRTLEKQKQ